jgi:hypothetical protein
MQKDERWVAVAGFRDLYGCTVCVDDGTLGSPPFERNVGSKCVSAYLM